jgi:CheY-like chemotaxis protein
VSPNPNPLRVLLVEDSHADALVAERALQVSDGAFEITITGSLGAGLDRLAQGFDAILLDLTLPDSAGTETVERMRAAAHDVPIVVLTSAGDEIADGCILAGADAYRQKGRIGPTGLGDVLSRAIARGHKTSDAEARHLRSFHESRLPPPRGSR